MKRSLSVASVVVMLVAGSLPVGAATFTGVFSGAAENPPNDSPGTGNAEVELDPVQHVLRVDVSFSGLESPSTIAHIHCCVPVGESADVATTVPTFPGFPANVTSGTYQMMFDTTMESTFNPAFIASHGGTAAGAEAALLEGLENGMAYFNIHTMMFGAGEIRADLSSVGPATPSATSGAATPTGTPGTPPTATATISPGTPVGTATATITPATPAGTATVTGQATATPTGLATGSPSGTSGTPTATALSGSPTTTSSTSVSTPSVTPSRGTATGSPVTTATGSPVRTTTGSPVRTGTPQPEDDGCNVVAPERSDGGALFLLVPAALLIAARRRRP